MTQFLSYAKDSQGIPTKGLPFPAVCKSASITAGSTTPLTVPSTSTNWNLLLSYSNAANVWVAVNATASPPVGATFADATSILNPSELKVSAGDVISFNNNGSGTATVSASLYALV